VLIQRVLSPAPPGATHIDFIAIMAFSVATQKAGSARFAAGRPAKRAVAARAVTLKELPYAMDALEPHMSKSTFEFHWGKHLRA
jgi:hypothetical protein